MDSLLDRTYVLLDDCQLSNRRLAREIGMSEAWVSLLRRRGVPNPGVLTIERLHAYLSKRDQDRAA